MILTTLCYIEKDGAYLMLHRTKKEQDPSKGKWIGIGGKFLPGESPEDCLLREVKEETGLALTEWRFRGIVSFMPEDPAAQELMFLYTAPYPKQHKGLLPDCPEGELAWILKDKVPELNLWEGDRIFLKLLDEREDFFSLKLVYEGDRLVGYALDGKPSKNA